MKLVSKTITTKNISNKEIASLDIIPLNSNTEASDAYCGKGQFFLLGPKNEDGLFPHVKIFCNKYGCPTCGPKKRYKFQCAIRDAIQKYDLSIFATLTLDPGNCSANNSVKYLKKTWNKHRVLQRRELEHLPDYVAVTEFQKNGYAHWHLMLSSYIDPIWLKTSWQRVGGGKIVDIRSGDNGVGSYAAKYLSKSFDESKYGRFRRVSTSRKIKLFLNKNSQFTFQPMNYFEAKKILGPCVKGNILFGNKLISGFIATQPMRVFK